MLDKLFSDKNLTVLAWGAAIIIGYKYIKEVEKLNLEIKILKQQADDGAAYEKAYGRPFVNGMKISMRQQRVC